MHWRGGRSSGGEASRAPVATVGRAQARHWDVSDDVGDDRIAIACQVGDVNKHCGGLRAECVMRHHFFRTVDGFKSVHGASHILHAHFLGDFAA